jgi:site-specific DNA-methyltransferase (adenine-specific)
MNTQDKIRAVRNKTITLSDEETNKYRRRLIQLNSSADLESVLDKTINQDVFNVIEYLSEFSL